MSYRATGVLDIFTARPASTFGGGGTGVKVATTSTIAPPPGAGTALPPAAVTGTSNLIKWGIPIALVGIGGFLYLRKRRKAAGGEG